MFSTIKIYKQLLLQDAGSGSNYHCNTVTRCNTSICLSIHLASAETVSVSWLRNCDSSVLYHEFFHAQDLYSGLDAFVTKSLGDEIGGELMGFYTYERCYRLFGIKMGMNQMTEWQGYWNNLLK